MPPPVNTTLVVGIDFGTTFSGVSWFIHKTNSPPGQPEVISLWQTSADNRKKNSDSQKVPSKMYYNENGELSWGFKVPAGVKAVEWFKLLLLNHKDLQKHLQNCSHINDANESLQKLGMTAVQLVGEYLKVLWNHALGQIYDAKGQNIIDGMPFLVVLTVPAIWTNYARERMREAADLAGILKSRVAGKTTLTFISEPEAAAIATMPELNNRGDLLVGDTIVVVDAGGGTVDIISYRVNKLEPLSMSEYVEGEGDLCGGTFLDNEFEKLLKTTVGMAAWSKMNGSDIRKVMNNEWEHGIKQAFDGDPDYYTVELPNRARKAPLRFSTNQIQPVFYKIVSRITELVNGQIGAIQAKSSRLPKLVILVGGFGRSPYILRHLRQELDPRISVLQARGDKPWTAVCRGAALSGAADLSSSPRNTPKLVQSRIARSNYGWCFSTRFKKRVHKMEDRYWDEHYEEWCAGNQVQWIVRRGEDISTRQPKTYDFDRSWDSDAQGLRATSERIYACDDMNPPSRLEENCELVVGSRTSYRLESYKLKITVSGSALDISWVSNGTEQKANVRIDVN